MGIFASGRWRSVCGNWRPLSSRLWKQSASTAGLRWLMADLQHLVSFVQASEQGSFSAAARILGLTSAAVSKNVARLEGELRMRLFHRSTRQLALTEEGERFLQQVAGPLASLQGALTGGQRRDDAPAGTLKVSMGQGFGRNFLVPLLGEFLARYPAVLPDWHFDNRQVEYRRRRFRCGDRRGLRTDARRGRARTGADPYRRRRVPRLSGGAETAARPAGSGLLRRHHAPLCADRSGAPVDAAITARGRTDRALQAPAHLQRPGGHGERRPGSGLAWRCCRCPSPSASSTAASWCACCRVGTAMPARFRCTTRAEDAAGKDQGFRRFCRAAL